MKFPVAVFLCLILSNQLPLYAQSLPNDQVTIMNAANGNLDFKIYRKPYKTLRFGKIIEALIKKLESEHEKLTGEYRYRLTHIRIVADDIQALIFANELGDTHFYSLDHGKIDTTCSLTMTGNGFSACRRADD